MEVLEHILKVEELMMEIKKLNPKICIVTIPKLGYICNRLRLLLGGKVPITNVCFYIREHVRYWTVRGFKFWSNKLGFRVKEIKGQYGFPVLRKIFLHYLLQE